MFATQFRYNHQPTLAHLKNHTNHSLTGQTISSLNHAANVASNIAAFAFPFHYQAEIVGALAVAGSDELAAYFQSHLTIASRQDSYGYD